VAPFKQLKGGVEFRKEIPKAASGKILRRLLRDELRQTSWSQVSWSQMNWKRCHFVIYQCCIKQNGVILLTCMGYREAVLTMAQCFLDS